MKLFGFQYLLTFLLIGPWQACVEVHPAQGQSGPIPHLQWDALLKKHVAPNGQVDYNGFLADRTSLGRYLELLGANPPNESTWSREEQIAYWINAYNAFTIDLVLQYYPIKSIKDIGSTIQVPFVNTPWDIKFIEIGGEKYDLNNLEHGILRKKYDEPRVHFALNCASFSCPVLRAEAYTAANLEAQLDDQARLFINDPSKNDIQAAEAKLSKLFDWYAGDFKKKTTLEYYINQYSKVKIEKSTKIGYMEYLWDLNDMAK